MMKKNSARGKQTNPMNTPSTQGFVGKRLKTTSRTKPFSPREANKGKK